MNNKKSRFKRSVRRYIFQLIIVLLVFLVILFVLWYLSNDEANNIISLKTEEASIHKGLDNAAVLHVRKPEADRLFNILHESLPNEFDAVVNIPKKIKSVGKVNNLNTQVGVGNIVHASDILPAYYEISIKADGTIKDIAEFIYEVESGRYYFTFKSFSIQPLGDADAKMQLLLNGFVYIDMSGETDLYKL